VKEVILTPEGYEKLKQEIDTLSTERRREVADRIRVARDFGDISENAEYDDAKNEQAMLEHKIATLEERLANARVIESRDVDLSVVSVGAKVRLKDVGANQTVEYTIVGSAEADPSELKLSNESPVGKAIIGKKKGETVEVAAPRSAYRPRRSALRTGARVAPLHSAACCRSASPTGTRSPRFGRRPRSSRSARPTSRGRSGWPDE
jgi:transcription elongation factor GreA